MYKFFVAICVSSVLLSSCNDSGSSDDPLSQAPYDKITDSINRAPGRAELFYRRGSLLYANNQLVFAEKDMRRAWELDPKEEYAVALTALLKRNNTDSAIVFIQDALKKLPGDVFLQIALARGYQQKKQTDKAIEVCDAVIRQYPNAIDAYLLKSEMLKGEDRNADAIQTLEQAYRYSPGDVDIVHSLAFDYAEAKNAKVLSLADSLIKADTEKKHPEPYYFKGLYFENTGNSVEAIKNFDEAIHHDYYFMDAYMDKGETLFNEKKYPQALAVFTLATTISRTYADAYYWLGKTQEVMGNKTEAKTNYQLAYGMDKTLTEAKAAADRL